MLNNLAQDPQGTWSPGSELSPFQMQAHVFPVKGKTLELAGSRLLMQPHFTFEEMKTQREEKSLV